MEPKPIDFAIANLLKNPELQPEDVKSLFKRLNEIGEVMTNIDKSIQEAKKSIAALYENRAKNAGAFETVTSMIEEKLSKELVEKYGKEVIS
jgi:hypothetical protein